jgi:hypothetical protein
VYTELGSRRDSPAKEEQRIEDVEHQRNGSMAHEGFIEGDCYQVEQRQHGEDSDEHVVVDDGGIAAEGVGDDVADEGHDEDGPYELRDSKWLVRRWAHGTVADLQTAQAEIENFRNHVDVLSCDVRG